MNILQLIQKPQKRGAEIFASQLSNHLVALGHEVKVVAIFRGDASLPFKGEISCLNAKTTTRFFAYQSWKKLADIIKEFKPDIVQANAGDTLKYLVFSKLVFRWKTPIVVRNASEVGRYLKSFIQKQYNSFLYKQVFQIISVSKASEKDILIHFPFLLGKTTVISVGVESNLNIEKIELLPKNKQHIVHVGGFSFEKNHKALLRIFEKVLVLNSEIQLHLIGDGPLFNDIKDLVAQMKLTNNVVFYGFINNPLPYIKAADILVLPSIIEGLPGVLLEAMLCKTPVIAYDVGGIAEIVNDNTGSLIKQGDEKIFSEKINEIIEKPNELQVEKAYAKVTKEYVNNQIVLKFEGAYNSTIRLINPRNN